MKEIRTIKEQPADPEKLQSGHVAEHTVTERLEDAAEHLSKMKELRPEVWSGLTETKREWCLRQVGQKLSEAHECPAPPFISGNFKQDERGITLGEHSDSDYIIKLNREVLTMNDSGQALETYCHEFHHAYQHEMAGRYNSAFRHLCHNEAQAKQWSENLRPGSYVSFEKDPEGYAAQPVERDARDFATKIMEEVRKRQ